MVPYRIVSTGVISRPFKKSVISNSSVAFNPKAQLPHFHPKVSQVQPPKVARYTRILKCKCPWAVVHPYHQKSSLLVYPPYHKHTTKFTFYFSQVYYTVNVIIRINLPKWQYFYLKKVSYKRRRVVPGRL